MARADSIAMSICSYQIQDPLALNEKASMFPPRPSGRLVSPFTSPETAPRRLWDHPQR